MHVIQVDSLRPTNVQLVVQRKYSYDFIALKSAQYFDSLRIEKLVESADYILDDHFSQRCVFIVWIRCLVAVTTELNYPLCYLQTAPNIAWVHAHFTRDEFKTPAIKDSFHIAQSWSEDGKNLL